METHLLRQFEKPRLRGVVSRILNSFPRRSNALAISLPPVTSKIARMNAPADPYDVGIVTAFFDIGRGGWTEDHGHPWYLQRATNTYFERFGHLATLENEMVVYTSHDLAPRVIALRKGKENRTTVIPVSLADSFPKWREAIRRVQTSAAFKNKIQPHQVRNPEYWSPDYVMVTNLKVFFVAHAVQNNLFYNPQAAWLDFGTVEASKPWADIRDGGIRLHRVKSICSPSIITGNIPRSKTWSPTTLSASAGPPSSRNGIYGRKWPASRLAPSMNCLAGTWPMTIRPCGIWPRATVRNCSS